MNFELYGLSTGSSEAFHPNPSLATSLCMVVATECLDPAAVGADWIAFTPPSQDPEHSIPMFDYQNIQTDEVKGDPSDRTRTEDLNSPALTRSICPPLTLPQAGAAYEGLGLGFTVWGSLTLDGRFALAAGAGGSYLERCGSHLHEFLTYDTGATSCGHLACPPPENSHAIIWQSAYGGLAGIFLPSRQRFSIPVSATVEPGEIGTPRGGPADNDGVTLALTPRTLYLGNENGQIWTTPSPAAPAHAHS